MKTIKHLFYFIIATFVAAGCGNKHEETQQDADIVEITKLQFETNSMQLGKIETKVFETVVKCNGSVVPQPNAIAKVNAPLNGIIRNINCFNGQSVEKNQTLIEISGNEIIELQKEFAETAANYKRLKSEYERIKALYNEKVTSEKDFISAESEYKASLAKFSALKMKLETLGLNTSKIENGEFYSSYYIKSPINGYISNLNAAVGSYMDSQAELLEIVNPALLQLKLAVFAADIVNLKKGQTVRFRPSNANDYHFGTISAIGVTVDDETKSIPCYAGISDGKSSAFIVNSYVEAEIIVKTDTAKVLPAGALIKSNDKNFILILQNQDNDKYVFKKQQITVGRDFKDYFEVLNDNIDGTILVKGAYYFEN